MSICITKDNIDLFAYTNEKSLNARPVAICLNFHGLGAPGMRDCDDWFDDLMTARGVLCVTPYYGPWSWMNFTAVKMVDDIVDAAFARFNLPETTPVLSYGGSMGGLSALIYTLYAKRTPVACACNCPVCDLVYHSTERPDLPRTMIDAFGSYQCGVDRAIELHSPLHRVADMPRIPYCILHGSADLAVNKAMHSDRLVAAMREAGHDVTYLEAEGMGHCDIGAFPEMGKALHDWLLSHI